MTGPRVAIVHDWLTGMRGGEKVLEVLCERYPDADLFTLLHVRGSVSPVIERRRIATSWLQRLPAARRYYRQSLPVFPLLIEQFDLDRYDVVISSSHCVAKSVITRPGSTHVCYCHTPMRYAWDQFDAYFGPARVGRVASALLRPVLATLARWDRATADRVQRYVTNSHHVARRIRQYYNREASVVYPPIDTTFFQPDASAVPGNNARRECLIVSALVPYKRIEIAIDACRIAGVDLAIVGGGPDRVRLERIAAEHASPASLGSQVRFLGRLSDADVRAAYQRAAAVLMPGEEDFGIVPLEAQACGRPVVALAVGGARETIVDGETGVLVEEAGSEAFADGIRAALGRSFDPAAIRRHAEGFGRERFGDAIEGIVSETRAGAGRAW